ncbi:MFS-type transporter SLC18B1-like isoform X2 [Patiria miniata]|uniref:Major facilitator superfamily (MFS) profile domain-containing protein n=1 Tax=Patiria miniata TaxID=46514 RepID=A0A913ZID7_PATMI|nr:MFS-type transporter SLC18B1-like isoform X2 [Patiria miniata]
MDHDEISLSGKSNLEATPTASNDNTLVMEKNQWQETVVDDTPTIKSNPAASEGDSAAAPTSKFTFHQKITFLSVALTSLSTWSTYSVIAVFFPTEAAAKGMSPTVVGLVFSSFSVASGISAPIFGKLPLFGARFVFLAGAFVTGGCNLLFGFLENMAPGATFTAFCFAIRTLEGLGSSACNTASGAIISFTFPENVGAAMSLLECVIGMSFAIGPAMGGLIYNAGGFKLPFFVLGGLVLVCFAINYFLMPDHASEHEESGSMVQVLKIPAIWVLLLFLCTSTVGFSSMDPVLSPHLQQLGYGVVGRSLTFAAFGAFYAFSAIPLGYIVDKKGCTRTLMVLGAFGTVIGFLLLGPSPLLNITPSVVLIGVVLPFIAIMLAMMTIPTLPDMLITAKWYGVPDNLGLIGIVSGLWNAVMSFGAMLGPIVSGTLTDHYGFEYFTTVIASWFVVVMLIGCFFGVWEYRCGKGRRLPKEGVGVKASSTEEEKVLLLSEEA